MAQRRKRGEGSVNIRDGNAQIPGYDDFWWDTTDKDSRELMSLKQAKAVTLFAKKNVPFYTEHYKNLTEEKISSINSLSEFVDIVPFITKEHLAKNGPFSFIPLTGVNETDPRLGNYFKFGTGGTTGSPIQVFHSLEDWRGMMMTLKRSIDFDFKHDTIFKAKLGLAEGENPLINATIFGGYHGDHITNHIYGYVLRSLGSHFVGRASTKISVEHNYELMQELKVNGILAPPEDESDKQTKGMLLDRFLELDSKNTNKDAWNLSHRYNKNFKFIFWSSMPISGRLLVHLRDHRQIPYIKGHFGSTEVCPTASTCSVYMKDFHLDYGHSLVLMKSVNGDGLAAPDEAGYTLVSKIGAVSKDGRIVLPTGSIFINYFTGDTGKLSEAKKCMCGRNTPVLYDIKRAEFKSGKSDFGCHIG